MFPEDKSFHFNMAIKRPARCFGNRQPFKPPYCGNLSLFECTSTACIFCNFPTSLQALDVGILEKIDIMLLNYQANHLFTTENIISSFKFRDSEKFLRVRRYFAKKNFYWRLSSSMTKMHSCSSGTSSNKVIVITIYPLLKRPSSNQYAI